MSAPGCLAAAVILIRAHPCVREPLGLEESQVATPTTAMAHIAIQEALDGKAVEWMEKVSDEQYRKS